MREKSKARELYLFSPVYPEAKLQFALIDQFSFFVDPADSVEVDGETLLLFNFTQNN